jgi:hypothetical protein
MLEHVHLLISRKGDRGKGPSEVKYIRVRVVEGVAILAGPATTISMCIGTTNFDKR